MDRFSLTNSLQRFFVLQHFSPDEVGPYAETIYESCGWIDGARFELVCKELAKDIKTNQRLKPGHFIGKYKELAALNGWNRQESSKCATCSGAGLVYVWVGDDQGREYRAMRGCSTCNERLSGLKEGLKELAEPPFNAVPRIADLVLQPSHAKILFRIAENGNFRVPDAMMERVTYWASQPDPVAARVRQLEDHDPEERKRKAEAMAVILRTAYAEVPTPGYQQTAAAPPPAPVEEPAVEEPVPPAAAAPAPIKSTPTMISAEDAAAMDMPF